MEFHLLPGEHQVKSMMVINCVKKFLLTGVANASSLPVLFCHPKVAIIVLYSYNVTISNLVIKNCNCRTASVTSYNANVTHTHKHVPTLDDYASTISVLLFVCIHCKIRSVALFNHGDYGLLGVNIVGEAKMENINVTINMRPNGTASCNSGILLLFRNSIKYLNYSNAVVINGLVVNDNNTSDHSCVLFGGVLDLLFKQTKFNINIMIINSEFNNLELSGKPAISIAMDSYSCTNRVMIQHCFFKYNKFVQSRRELIAISLKQVNASVTFENCVFASNKEMITLISVTSDSNNFLGSNCASSNVSR